MARDTNFSSELIHIMVEGVIYSIPKRIFNDSAVFSDMYDLPQDPCHPADGVDEAHPLKLDGTKKTDFENFLRLFISGEQTSLIRPPTLSKDAWVSVLHLTDRWQMPHARAVAVTALTRLLEDPVEKLVLADRYFVTAWTEPALAQLVDRDAPLSVADVERIGITRGVKVSTLREQIFARPRGFTYDIPCRCDVEANTTRQTNYHGHSHALSSSTCTGCRKECLKSTLCRDCQTIRCSTCRKGVGVVENVIGRPKVSRLAIRRVFGGWVYDVLKFLAFRLIILALLVFVAYKLSMRYTGL